MLAAVRSKAVTLSKKHPDMMQIASRSNDTKNLPLCNRVNIELDRYMLESSNVQKHLAKMPIESTLDHLDQRNTVILKGLQILEKIQKIGNPQGSDAPKTITRVSREQHYNVFKLFHFDLFFHRIISLFLFMVRFWCKGLYNY